jgi:hypothetical protein
METNDPNRQADALFKALNGQINPDDPDLPRQEADLAGSLRELAHEIHTDPRFKAGLEARLKNTAGQKAARSRFSLRSLGLGLSWIALGALLLIGLGWAIQNLLPRPAGPVPVVATSTGQPTRSTDPIGVETAQPSDNPTPVSTAMPPTPVPAAPSFTSDLYPGIEWLVPVPFPEAPNTVTLYLQQPAETITIDGARAMAAKLGVTGGVYQMPSEATGQLVYVIANSKQRVTFINSPNNFDYIADNTTVLQKSSSLPPVEQQIAAATEFLESHGLLDFPYQVDTSQFHPGMVGFSPKLDDLPVYYNNLGPALINVTINAQGQVALVNYQLFASQPLGEYPIRTAQDALQKAFSTSTVSGVEMTGASYTPNTYRSWQREHPVGQPVDLYGYPEVLQPAEPGTAPFVSLNNYQLLGNVEPLTQAYQPGKFFHVWGQFQTGEQGEHIFQLDGWEVSLYPDITYEGLIQRQGDLAYFLTQGKQLLLPELPADAPEAITVTVRGVEVSQPELKMDWSEVMFGGGGGGGGGGGVAFAELNLDGLGATPEPLPTPPVQNGQRIDGLRGNIYVVIHQYTDGVRKADVTFYTDDTSAFPQGLNAYLEGAGLAGIEAYHNLPVRIWGTVTNASTLLPYIQVERYEPVYPDITRQAWLGTAESVVLEGQPVLRFASQDGEQFILSSSINPSEDYTIGEPGEALIIEGVLYPEETYAGYPVITDMSAILAGDRTNLDGYELSSSKPTVIQETTQAGVLQKATVDKIELIYQTVWRQSMSPQDAPPTYLQPVWRFTGHYEDGSTFDIMVQALTDEYLK